MSTTSGSGFDDEVKPGTIAKWGVVALLVVLALTWLLQGNDFFLYRVFAPRQEAVRNDVFKQSQAYNDGMANELAGIQREYATTTDTNAKLILLSTAYNRFASYDASRLPPNLQAFLGSVRAFKTTPNTKLP